MSPEDKLIPSDQITPMDSELVIISFTAAPYPDQKRVKVNFQLSSFQQPPDATITIFGKEGEELASVDVVNISQSDNEITLHLPISHPGKGECQVELKLYNLDERQAREDEKGEVKLTTKNLSSTRTTFTLQ